MFDVVKRSRLRGNRGALDGRDDRAGDHVRVGVGCRATVFQPALPAAFDGSDRDSDRSTTVRNAVAELVDRLGFVQTGQTLIVVGTVNVDVFLDPRLESLTDRFVHVLAAAGPQGRVAEVRVHAAAVPVTLDRLGLVIDRQAVILGGAVQQVTGDPDLVAGFLGTLGKDLELPLTHHHFGVDAFDVQAGLQAQFQVFFDDFTSDSTTATDAAVVRALRAGITFGGEAQRLVRFRIPQRVFLFETEPEIVVVVVDRAAAVGAVRGSVGVQDFAHHQETGADAARIGNDVNGFEQQVRRATIGLFGAASVEAPNLRVFQLATEIVFDLGLAAKRLGRLIAIQPDVFQLALGHKIDSPLVNQNEFDLSVPPYVVKPDTNEAHSI